MKKFILLLITGVILTTLAGCGQEPLKFRNLLEADQYIRNNIQSLTWQEFEELTLTGHHVKKEEFEYIKTLLNKKYSSFHLNVDDKFYRFSRDKKLMYMTKWREVKGTYFLEDISYVEKE
jgi:hypothetical protein